MDLTKVYEFWEELDTKELCLALWALLAVLFEIIHEWRDEDAGKDMGMGTNPRRAILWHATEFMTGEH